MKKLILAFFFLIFLIDFCFNIQIHILQQTFDNDKNLRGNKRIAKYDSPFSKICTSVFSTYYNLGEKSFDIYKGCQGKYELLGSSDKEIIKERPFCFDSMNQFFCNYKIENMQAEQQSTETVNPACGSETLIELVLSIIKGCVKEKLNNNSNGNYKCPSLDEITYKISNPKDFCIQAEKKELLAAEEGAQSSGPAYEYSQVKEDDKQHCEYVTEMYNACIDADNLLFPFSDYKKCFIYTNSLYLCNRIERFSNQESDLCSKFILPTLASSSLHSNLYSIGKEICSDYESKVTKSHDNYMATLENNIAQENSLISEIDKILENNSNLSAYSHRVLNSITQLNKQWIEFYPEMSSTFKIRQNLTEVEYTQLSKLRISFDEIFPYAANLNALTEEEKFVLSNFTSLNDAIRAYYQKTEIYIDDLSSSIDRVNVVLSLNLNLTLLKDNPESKEHFMVTQSVNYDEVLAFQNEFVEISQYLKRFMNLVMKRINETHAEYTDQKSKRELAIDGLRVYIERIKKQKEEVYKVILA